MNRFGFLAAFSLLSASALCAAEISTTLGQRTVYAGEPAQLILRVNESGQPYFEKEPEAEGIEWLGRASSVRYESVNGRMSIVSECAYNFVAAKPGKYTIPSAKVVINGKVMESKAVTFEAEKPRLGRASGGRGVPSGGTREEAQVEIDKAVFAGAALPDKRTVYYAGEEIPVEIVLHVMNGVQANLSYPEILAGNGETIIFRDYGDINQENSKFDRPVRFSDEIDGQNYTCYRFRTHLRAISTGKLDLSIAIPMEIRTRDSRRSADPFFDDFFDSGFFGGRSIRHTATAKIENLEIKPLPKPAAGTAKYLGLIGTWKIVPSLSKTETAVGNAVTLKIQISGRGGLETLRPPELEFPGFRVYSPETTKASDGSSAEIRYILIPTKEGKESLSAAFSVFDAETGKYVETPFRTSVTVGKAEGINRGLATPGVIDSAADGERVLSNGNPKHGPSGVLYLKKAPFRKVWLPLWKNSVLAIGGFLLFGMLFWAIAEIVYREKILKGRDPGYARMESARRQKSRLLALLRKGEPSSVYGKTPEIAQYLNDALNLPPGTDLDEIAEHLKSNSPELSEDLRGISRGAWAPGAAEFTGERLEKFVKMLGKIVCFTLIAGAFQLSAGIPKTADEAMTAYDEGRFEDAKAYYKSMETAAVPAPALLYNIGNCLYQEGRYAAALGYYEKALRLSPRDSDIVENLNLTRRKLSLPEKYRLESPGDVPAYLRDSMRPDEWYVFAALGAAVFLTGLGLRRFSRRIVWLTFLSAGLAMILLGLLAPVSQSYTSHLENTAIVTERSVPFRVLPSETARKLDTVLIPGEEVTIVEKRSDWVRIRAGEAEGWVRSGDLFRL